MTTEIISLTLNALLGGSLIITIVTLRSTVKKAREEAKKVALDNDNQAMQTFQAYIVDPLKKEVKSLRNEINKMRKAIERISACDYADNCPVKRELQQESSTNPSSDNDND